MGSRSREPLPSTPPTPTDGVGGISVTAIKPPSTPTDCGPWGDLGNTRDRIASSLRRPHRRNFRTAALPVAKVRHSKSPTGKRNTDGAVVIQIVQAELSSLPPTIPADHDPQAAEQRPDDDGGGLGDDVLPRSLNAVNTERLQ